MHTLFKQLVQFAKKHQRRPLPTLGGRSRFSLSVDEDAFTYQPLTTNKPRQQTFFHANRVFERYNQTLSLTTSDYLDITVNSSYILALIKAFVSDGWEQHPPSKNADTHAMEGILQERRILSRTRNRLLAEARKERDQHTCQSCGFNKYIDGRSVIECHHLYPFRGAQPRVTDIDHLVSLCPTCHRLAHLRIPPVRITELQRVVKGACRDIGTN